VGVAGLKTPQAAIELLALAKRESGEAVEAFELMSRQALDFTVKNMPGLREPLQDRHPWYVLVETVGGDKGGAQASLERVMGAALEAGLASDVAIAQSDAQARLMWRMREDMSAAQKPEGVVWKHDISAPVAKVPAFLEQATAALEQRWPGCRVAAFGHVGDGNIHYNIAQPIEGDAAAFAADRDAGARMVHDIVAAMEGSISAEHGLGAMKTTEALRYKSSVEVEAMRAVRRALDPKRIMNPRVLF
jgi:FAD/FMN-containing dehydrogenase